MVSMGWCRGLALCVLLALVGHHACAAERVPSSQLQSSSFDRLGARLNNQLHDAPSGSNLGGLQTPAPAQPQQQPTRARSLLQLAGSFRDTRLANGQLVSTTARDAQVTAPTYQAVTREISSVGVPVDPAASDRLAVTATPSPGLSAINAALSDVGAVLDSLIPKGPAALQMEPVVAALDGAAQQQSQQQPQQQQQQVPLQPTLRILGGVEAPTDRKYVCSLRTASGDQNDFLYCGCSLIAPTVVMTAAHCIAETSISNPMVEIGRYYQQRANDTGVNDYDRIKCVASVYNRGWTTSVGQNDIGLCFLESASRFAPVKLGSQNTTKLTANQQLAVMGWGATTEGGSQSSALLSVDVDLIDRQTCQDAYSSDAISGDTQLCAGVPEGGKDACQGDSGGPLVVKGATGRDDVQVGIVSFGIGCGRPNIPGVYTDVRAFRDWIAQKMLARGVTYDPVTAGFTAPASPVNQATACACTTDGNSGGTFLGTDLAGCKQHGLSVGDTSYYCYTAGGTNCDTATASTAYPGAAWIDCTPPVTSTSSSQATPSPSPQPAPTAPTQSPQAPTSQAPSAPASPAAGPSTAESLAALLGQLFGLSRQSPNGTQVAAANSTFASNRTALISRRSAGGVGSRRQVAVRG